MSETPTVLGLSWDAFVREWVLDGELAYSQDEVQRALSAIERHWPEKVLEVVNGPARGTAIAVPVVDHGLLLADCERLNGFDAVAARLRRGERSAYSELVLASALCRLGHSPILEPPIGGKCLDASCEVDQVPVFFEVITPERSDESGERSEWIDRLTQAVKLAVKGCRVEVAVQSTLDGISIERIVDLVTTVPAGCWMQLDSLARVRRIDQGQLLPPTFDGTGSIVIFAGEHHLQGPTTGVIVKWEDSDDRASRQFTAEYHHFAEGVANVLVVNACAVPDGLESWELHLRRLFQPTRNRKVSAAAIFDQGILGPPEAIRRRWRTVENAYARVRVPSSLLNGFQSLDESAFG